MHNVHDHIHTGTIPLFPGIDASYNTFHCNQIEFQHEAFPNVLEIHHCHYGRIGWDLANNTSIYLGEGDVAMHSCVLCSNSVAHFPRGTFEGVSFIINFDILEANIPEIIKEADLNLSRIRQTFCSTETSVTISGDKTIEQIFSALYHKPEKLQTSYLKIKILELLLYLNELNTNITPSAAYNSDIVKSVQAVHSFLLEDLSVRYTINDLSAKFLINTSTLKDAFKAVYGQPIATYMKEYRMQHAAKLLKHTNASLSEIANEVGYGTQSKFTQAFKDCLGVLPSEYRKL